MSLKLHLLSTVCHLNIIYQNISDQLGHPIWAWNVSVENKKEIVENNI